MSLQLIAEKGISFPYMEFQSTGIDNRKELELVGLRNKLQV